MFGDSYSKKLWREKPYILLIFGVAFLLFGAGSTVLYEMKIGDAQPVTGTVQSSSVETTMEVRTTETDDALRETTVYHANVTYTYVVNGQQYQNNQLYPLADNELSEQKAKDMVERFQSGETVTVYVNPENPRHVFLLKRNKLATTFFVVGGLGVLFGAVGMIRKRLREDRDDGGKHAYDWEEEEA